MAAKALSKVTPVTDTVATPSVAWTAMAAYWDLPRTLMGGTEAMRLARTTYLPKYEAESQKAYNARIKMTVLRNFYRRTVGNLAHKMHANPIVVNQNLPEPLFSYLENIDLAGRNIDVFSQAVAKLGIQEGLSYIFVDFNAASPAPSLAAERASGARPYCIHLSASSVLGVKYAIQDGAIAVQELRYLRTVTEASGEHGEVQVDEVYVIRPTTWERWRINEATGKWYIPENNADQTFQGVNSLGRVALIPFYTGYEAPFEAIPPMDDLAQMNLEHWQIRSDQRNALNVASFPILAASGYNSKTDTQEVVVGPRKFLASSDPQGKFYYVEHQGKAIEVGAKELQELEKQMRAYGLQFEMETTDAATATGRKLDAGEAMAPVIAWAMGLEQALNEVVQAMADWEKMKLPSTKEKWIKMSVDPAQGATEAKDLQALKDARANRDISRQAYLRELQRRNIISDDYDEEADKELLDEEASSMTDMQTGDASAEIDPATGLPINQPGA